MNSKNALSNETDFQKIFDDMENQTENLFPNLQQELKTFNDSYIVVESYQQYVNSMEQMSNAITSNHVS